jgi:hypothetical protein
MKSYGMLILVLSCIIVSLCERSWLWGMCVLTEMYVFLNPLKTKRKLLYLKTQSVPRSKHFSSRL